MAHIFAVVNRKGGVGKTTTAVNLAHGLARKLVDSAGEPRGSVLLVDLDPQSNCSQMLGLDPGGICISQLLLGNRTLDSTILSADRSAKGGPARPNLFLIPSSDALAQAKIALIANEAVAEVVSRMTRGAQRQTPIDQLLSEKLGPATQVFDYIILDCPPSLDALNDAVYRFAEAAIVPVKVDYLGATGAVRHTRDILEAQAEGIHIRIGLIVPTFVRERQVLAREVLATLRDTYGEERVSTPVPTSVKVEESPATGGGMTLFEYAPDSKAAQAYQDLVEKVYHGKV